MGYTKEEIFNITLNHLGINAIVQNTNEVNPKITALNNYYDMALEQVMKDYDWNFLNSFKVLTPTLEESPNPKYLYAYDYPNDCIAVRSIYGEKGTEYKQMDITTSSKGSRIIVCNAPKARLKYTRKLNISTPEAYFTSEFVSALSFYLAFLTANALTGNTGFQSNMYQAYQTTLGRAKAMDANESEIRDEDNRTYLDYRN